MLFKNMKVMLHLPYDYFDIIEVLQGDTISLYNLPRLCTINVYRSYKRKWFHTKKGKKQTISQKLSWIQTTQIIANTPAQAKSLLHSLEQAARSINICVNSYKIEFMCFR